MQKPKDRMNDPKDAGACARCGHSDLMHFPVCSDCGGRCGRFVDSRSASVSSTLPRVCLTMMEQVSLAMELLGNVVHRDDVCRFCCDDGGGGLVVAGDHQVHDAHCRWLRLMIATGTITGVRQMN
jgi:hypothetical protein